jgi:amidohydrolase
VSVSRPPRPEEIEELVRLRRDFHRHPELGFEEHRTSGIVAARMKELGLGVSAGVGGTGVLAGKGSGRTLLLRADMDALPIHEENDCDYRSVHDGLMHACGHDGHTAIAMTAAARLAAADLPGGFRMAFQPAEENGQGADRMIAEGALDGVDAAIGLHLWNWLPVGKVAVTSGPVMAAVDEFEIQVTGRGGHAASPQDADDPVVKAASLVQELQTIVSRRLDPAATAVVSVTAIHGGEAFNVIPSAVDLRGTVRTFDESVRAAVHKEIRRIVAGRGTCVIHRRTAPLVNDPAVAALVRKAAVDVVGEENVIDDLRSMTGEDFASFARVVPACFFHVGSAAPGAALHHHPRFDIDERSLGIGLQVLCRAAEGYLTGSGA